MNLRLERSYLLLAPIVLAYFSRGAKSSLAFVILFVVSASLFLMSSPTWSRRHTPVRLILPFGLFLLWSWLCLFSGAPLDVFLFFYARVVLYVFVGFLFFQTADSSMVSRFERLVVVLALVEAALIILTAIRGRIAESGGYLGHPLHSGLLLSAALSLSLAHIPSFGESRRRVAAHVAGIAALGTALLLVRSRAGMVATAVVCLFLFRKRIGWILVGATIFAGVTFALQGKALLTRLELDSLSIHSTVGRFGIWRTALDAIMFHPLIGGGLGNFEVAYRLFQRPSSEVFQFGKSTMFAHNGFLQVAADGGLPALAFLFWAYVALAKRVNFSRPENRSLAAMALVFFVFSIFNYSLFLPFNGLVFACGLGLAAAGTNLKEQAIDLPRRGLLPATLLSALSLFLVLYAGSDFLASRNRLSTATRLCPIRGDLWYEAALQGLREKQGEAFVFLQRALLWRRQDSFSWHRLALALVEFRPTETGAIDLAFAEARRLAPHHAPFLVQEGFYRLGRNELTAADRLFSTASSLEPLAASAHYGLQLVHMRRGEPEAAKAEHAKVLELLARRKELESDYFYGTSHREAFATPYAQALIGLDATKLRRP